MSYETDDPQVMPLSEGVAMEPIEAAGVGMVGRDAASIIEYLKSTCGLLIHQSVADRVRTAVRDASPANKGSIAIEGRDLDAGVPRTVVVTLDELRNAMRHASQFFVESTPANFLVGSSGGAEPMVAGLGPSGAVAIKNMQYAGTTLQLPQSAAVATAEEREAQLASQLVDEVAGNAPDVNALCETYQLRREELGRLTGFSVRALAEWAAGKLPSQPAKRRLQEVRRLLDALSEIVKRESIPHWLHRQNKAFDGLTPLQVIELGEMDRLWEMVHDMGSGQPE